MCAERTGALFGYLDLGARMPADHPLRAMLLQAFHPIRSERPLMKRPEFDLSFPPAQVS